MRIKLTGYFVITAVALLAPRIPIARAQKAELIVEAGHAAEVMSVAFSPDGRTVASASWDKTIKLWDVSSGHELRTLAGHKGWIDSVAFSPDGRFLVSGSEDNTVKIWDAATGRTLRTLAGHPKKVQSVAFSPNGRMVASGSDDKTLKLWDVASGGEVLTLVGHTESVESVAFSPDGHTLASGSLDNTIKLWDVASGKELRTLAGHSNWVESVAFSPDGRTLASGSEDNTVKLWDVASGREVLSLTGHTQRVDGLDFSPDGRMLASGSWDRTIKIWDLATGTELRTFTGHEHSVSSVAFSPNGRTLVSGSWDHTVKLWDVVSGRTLRTFAAQDNNVEAIAYSPDGRSLASGGEDFTVHLWDVASGGAQRTLGGHHNSVTSLAFTPDSRTLASGCFDGTIKLWDVVTGHELRTLDSSSAVDSLAFSPDGHVLASGTGNPMDSTGFSIDLWDVATERKLRTLDGHTYPVASVAFSPDGRTLASGSQDQTIKLWDVASGRELRTFNGHTDEVLSVAFSPDGHTLASASWDNTIRFWDVTTGSALRTLTGHADEVLSVAFSPDGHILASGSADNTIKVWDAATGQELRTLTGHSSSVNSVAFNSDGRLILSGAADGSDRIWDTASGDLLVTMQHFDRNQWVAADPLGRFDTNDLDGSAPLHWLVSDDPMHTLPLEIFMRDYYTPRLLARVMHGETLPLVRSIAEIKNRVQPDVSIVSIHASLKQSGRADVVVHATSHIGERGQVSGLQDLRLFRNGQLVGYREGTLQDNDFTFSGIQLPTSVRSVRFTAYAFNSERIKSATAEKDYAYKPGPPAKPRAWLVQIGVNHYQANGCELHGSATDAEKLSQVLTKRLIARGFAVKSALLVSTDEVNDATKVKIRSALASIAASATPDDVFFLSFSGHGYSNGKGQFYILPSDVQGTCKAVDEPMLQSAVSANELAEWLRPIDAGEMTFILDSCDSASSVEANNFKPGPMGSSGLGQLAYDKRMRILAASQPNQAARESDLLHQGLLSYALTEEGLIEGEADWQPKDGRILIGEWLAYAANAVPSILQSGSVGTHRGLLVVGEPEHDVPSFQTPALFDFSKRDTFVLQGLRLASSHPDL